MTNGTPSDPVAHARRRPGQGEALAFGLVLLIALATRIPFLDAGYGNDPDAWAVANAARRIAVTGQYTPSRLPGYPLHELASALLWRGGPPALNGCSALFGVVAVACFAGSLRRLGSPDYLLGGLALALTPVVFINSTVAMDYVWGLAFILGSHHAALCGRSILAGCLLGVAIGCRLTSGAMLLPLALLLVMSRPGPGGWPKSSGSGERFRRRGDFMKKVLNPWRAQSIPQVQRTWATRPPPGKEDASSGESLQSCVGHPPRSATAGEPRQAGGPTPRLVTERPASSRLRDTLSFVLSAVLIGTICYLPVVHREGFGFLTFSAPAEYESARPVLSRAFLRVWGPLGLIGLLIAVLLSAACWRGARRAPSIPATAGRGPLLAASAAVAIYAIMFLLLPLEEGYLIPAVPFVILLLGRVLPRAALRVACVGLCLSPFVCGFGRTAAAPPETRSGREWTFDLAGQGFYVDLFRGPVVRDYAERMHGMEFVSRVLAVGRTVPPGSVVVVGYWLPHIQAQLNEAGRDDNGPGGPQYVYLLNRTDLAAHRQAETPLYFLPAAAAFNRQVFGVDLRASGALPLEEYPYQ